MKYAPSATAQRLIEAKALPSDSSTPGLLDPRTPRRSFTRARRAETYSLGESKEPISADIHRAEGRVLLHDVLVGDFVYGHTCTHAPPWIIHATPVRFEDVESGPIACFGRLTVS
ncbi:hypothetical protein NXT08_23515 (plasmid) [Rhodococcus pyridinivorans]|uniref:hypothetical protein n=1 Tax=Rhodococcus TaxID=1827 RepID=UPI0007DA4330|nr:MULTISPECIES: hypothetical protein [Rhodococcus]MCT7293699.1 hypothetical protein [Rhodococcus sp. PAE-6]QXU56474.1 hypothetical protein KXC42_25200 [Rhodococcus sp. LW-XY12]UVT27534.1 hypothetical protein NXT08_23515 [Rhodococcus pyridinivorans]WML66203.1 hypothetical protein QNA09_28325 [Rhodococcus sp. AH-ZY2]WML66300.1 hypothetical protein QNA09_28870 [Rhodococcus sp. AH-ZY2]